jgi:hypothetical protein
MKTVAAILALVCAMGISPGHPLSACRADKQKQQAQALADGNDTVYINTNSKKYHTPSCIHLKRCTHCVAVKRSEARAQGGVPCKVCGGGEEA